MTIGSQVAKGDLLVDGKVPIYAEDGTIREYRMVIADADIRMEHSGHFRIFLPADYILKKYTGREKTGYFMRLGDLCRLKSLTIYCPYCVSDALFF